MRERSSLVGKLNAMFTLRESLLGHEGHTAQTECKYRLAKNNIAQEVTNESTHLDGGHIHAKVCCVDSVETEEISGQTEHEAAGTEQINASARRTVWCLSPPIVTVDVWIRPPRAHIYHLIRWKNSSNIYLCSGADLKRSTEERAESPSSPHVPFSAVASGRISWVCFSYFANTQKIIMHAINISHAFGVCAVVEESHGVDTSVLPLRPDCVKQFRKTSVLSAVDNDRLQLTMQSLGELIFRFVSACAVHNSSVWIDCPIYRSTWSAAMLRTFDVVFRSFCSPAAIESKSRCRYLAIYRNEVAVTITLNRTGTMAGLLLSCMADSPRFNVLCDPFLERSYCPPEKPHKGGRRIACFALLALLVQALNLRSMQTRREGTRRFADSKSIRHRKESLVFLHSTLIVFLCSVHKRKEMLHDTNWNMTAVCKSTSGTA